MSYFKSRNPIIDSGSDSESVSDAGSVKSIKFRNAFMVKSQNVNKNFDLKTEEFPDLVVGQKKNTGQKDTDIKSNNYVDIAATPTVKEVQIVEVPTGWVQYSRNKVTGKTTVTYGKKTNNQLVREKRILYEGESHFVTAMILKELSANWNKYKVTYDKIHGSNAYDELYYTEQIYPNLDAEFNSDEETESDYFNDSNYTYHYDSN